MFLLFFWSLWLIQLSVADLAFRPPMSPVVSPCAALLTGRAMDELGKALDYYQIVELNTPPAERLHLRGKK